MNVCHFGFSLSLISGHSKPAFELANYQKKIGLSVKILSSELPSKYLTLHNQLKERANIAIDEHRPFKSELGFVTSKSKVVSDILSWADIVHVYGPHSLFLLQRYLSLARKSVLKAKIVLSINSAYKMCFGDFINSGSSSFKNLANMSYLASLFPNEYFKMILSKADFVICWTQFMQEQVFSLGIKNSVFIPVGVNIKTSELTKNDFSKNFNFLYLGYLASARGVSDLLNAYEIVHSNWPSTKLRIMHTSLHPAEQNEFLKMLSRSKSSDSIKITGFNSNLSEGISTANVVVLPFRTYIGYSQPPLTVLEALALNRPVITTSVGCLPEIVTNGYNGFCIAPSNPRLLAKVMLKMRDVDLQSMSKNAGEYVSANHDWTKICRSTLNVYNGLL